MDSRIQAFLSGVLACLMTVGAAATAKVGALSPVKSSAPLALTVPDRNCPQLVRPFDVSGNVEKIALELAQEEIANTIQKHDKKGWLRGIPLPFQKSSPPPSNVTEPTGAVQDPAPQTSSAPAGVGNAMTQAAEVAQSAQVLNTIASHVPGGTLATAAIQLFGHLPKSASTGSALATVPGQAVPTQSGAPQQSDISNDLRRMIKQLDWLPMAAEVEYGRRDHERALDDILDRDSKEGRKLYPIADALLKDILSKVDEPVGYNFQLFILKTDDHNAIARPGGFVYLDAGLIKNPKLRPKAQFALAHEVGHVLQRHETLELQGLIVDSFAFKKELLEAINSMKGNPSTVLAKVKLEKHQYVRYHLDQELQADSCSARLLGRVYDDAPALARSLQAFIEDLPPEGAIAPGVGVASADTTATPANKTVIEVQKVTSVTEEIVNEPVNSHPSSGERRANLTAMYTELQGEIATRLAAGGPGAHEKGPGAVHHEP